MIHGNSSWCNFKCILLYLGPLVISKGNNTSTATLHHALFMYYVCLPEYSSAAASTQSALVPSYARMALGQ